MELQEGDIVLCTVEKIERTNVFVKIEVPGREIQGSIITSEIAAGRIRNIRDYVVPKKKIACKVLRVSGDRIDLSLRRVTLKEKKELMEQNSQERSYKSILKSVLGEKAEKIFEEIEKEESVFDFVEESKENPSKLEKQIGKKEAEKVLEILKSQKQKKSIVSKEFILKSKNPEGILQIKEILSNFKDVQIKYLAAGKYKIKTEDKDIKNADNRIKETLSEIENRAKKLNVEFETKEK